MEISDERLLALWDAKIDTFAIARALNQPEGVIANKLWHARENRRAKWPVAQ